MVALYSSPPAARCRDASVVLRDCRLCRCVVDMSAVVVYRVWRIVIPLSLSELLRNKPSGTGVLTICCTWSLVVRIPSVPGGVTDSRRAAPALAQPGRPAAAAAASVSVGAGERRAPCVASRLSATRRRGRCVCVVSGCRWRVTSVGGVSVSCRWCERRVRRLDGQQWSPWTSSRVCIG